MAQICYIVQDTTDAAVRQQFIDTHKDVMSGFLHSQDGHFMFSCEPAELEAKLAECNMAITENRDGEVAVFRYLTLAPLSFEEAPLTEGNPIQIMEWPSIIKGIKFRANEFANELWEYIQVEEKAKGLMFPRPIKIYKYKDEFTTVSANEDAGFSIHLGATALKNHATRVVTDFRTVEKQMGNGRIVAQGVKDALLIRSVAYNIVYGALYPNMLLISGRPASEAMYFYKFLCSSVLRAMLDPEAYEAAVQAEMKVKRDAETKAFADVILAESAASVEKLKAAIIVAKTDAAKTLAKYTTQLRSIESQARNLDTCESGGTALMEKWIKELDALRSLPVVYDVYVENKILTIITTEVISYNPYDKDYRNLGQLKFGFPIASAVLGIAPPPRNGEDEGAATLAHTVLCSAYSYPGKHLPHEMGGRTMCFGTGVSAITELLTQQEFVAAVIWLISFFETAVNPSDEAGKKIQQFDKVPKPAGR